jgi:pyridoxal phosphate enzyme (YggS family)
MSDLMETIRENLASVRRRIAEAAARSGRAADEVKLVAVTKFVSDAAVRALVEAGCQELGENRPQHLWEKVVRMADLPVRWHMIGTLQRNKVRRTLPLIEMLQSADNLPLVEAVERIAGDLSLRVPVLLEVNVSSEGAKHGFEPADIEPCLEPLARLEHLEVRGLMCMAGLEGGLERARRDFAALRELRDRLKPNCPDRVSLDELSMGMSGDFQVAIPEGATIVRIGSALFGGQAFLPVRE